MELSVEGGGVRREESQTEKKIAFPRTGRSSATPSLRKGWKRLCKTLSLKKKKIGKGERPKRNQRVQGVFLSGGPNILPPNGQDSGGQERLQRRTQELVWVLRKRFPAVVAEKKRVENFCMKNGRRPLTPHGGAWEELRGPSRREAWV